MNGQTVVPAAEAHPKLSVEERSVVNQWGNRSIQHVINLATVAEERKRLQNANKRKDTVEEDTRGRYDKRSAQGAKKKGSGKRAKHVKARTSNH